MFYQSEIRNPKSARPLRLTRVVGVATGFFGVAQISLDGFSRLSAPGAAISHAVYGVVSIISCR